MNVDLEPGDRLLTSGLDDVFPAGLPVAEVQSLERPTGEAFARAELRPLARLDRARHVLIVEVPEQPQPLSREDDSGADRKSTRLNSSHVAISYAVFCL